ncbi:MAG: hypothetical protein ACLFNM_00190 [Candidatus Woesearchaeota archaeon]
MIDKQDKKGIGFSMIMYLIIGVIVLLLLTLFFTNGFGRADSSVDEVTSPDTLFNRIGGAVSSLFSASEGVQSPSNAQYSDSSRGIQNE